MEALDPRGALQRVWGVLSPDLEEVLGPQGARQPREGILASYQGPVAYKEVVHTRGAHQHVEGVRLFDREGLLDPRGARRLEEDVLPSYQGQEEFDLSPPSSWSCQGAHCLGEGILSSG